MAKSDNVDEIHICSDKIIDSLVSLTKKLGLTNVLEIWTLFKSMASFGCFSYDSKVNHFISQNDLQKVDECLNEALYINGHGVCRHDAQFLQKFFSKLGYSSGISVGWMYDEASDYLISLLSNIKTHDEISAQEYIKNDYLKSIARKTDTHTEEQSIKYGNHMLTVVNNGKQTFYLDPANRVIYYSFTNGILKSNNNSLYIPNEKSTDYWSSYYGIENIPKLKTFYPSRKVDILRLEYEYYKYKTTFSSFHEENKETLMQAEKSLKLLQNNL